MALSFEPLVVFAIGRLCRMPLVGSPLIFAKLRLTDFADLRNNVGMSTALSKFREEIRSTPHKQRKLARIEQIARTIGVEPKRLRSYFYRNSVGRGDVIDRLADFYRNHDAAATDRRGYSTALEVNHKPGDRT
jgi:hypothetical protein